MADQELQSLVARLRANVSEMRRGFEDMADKAYQTTQKIGQRFDALGKRMQSIGRSMFLSITTPFSALVGFSIKAASDVQELQNLIAVTFGDATDSVRMWANETAKAVQRSQFSLLQAAGDFAAFLKPLGVAPERILPMSKALSALTTDIASFRNMADSEVAVRLFSGIAGETEAVRRLGIDLGQAAIEAELLRMGFEGNAAEANQALKAQARYNLIIEQTRDAQGDAARTAGSFENQMKGLSATIRDVRIAIGQQLIPVATEIVSKLRAAGQAFLSLDAAAQRNILVWGGIAAAVGPALIVLGTFVRLIGFSISGLGILGKAGVQTFALLGRAALAIPGAIFSIPAAIIAAGVAFYAFRDTVSAVFQSIVEYARALPKPITEPIRVAFQFLMDMGTHAKDYFFSILDVVINQFNRFIGSVKWLMGDTVQEIVVDTKNAATSIGAILSMTMPEFNMDRVKTAFSSDLNDIRETFKKVMGQIQGLTPNIDMGFLDQFEGANTDLEEFQQGLNALFASFDDFGSAANGTIDEARFNAKGLAEDLRQAFIGRLSDINSLGDAMSAVLDRLKAQLLEIIFFGTTGSGGLFGGIFNSIAGTFAGLFGGGKAAGGPVEAGRGYIVGEKGPEWFQPRSSGTIVPAGQTAQMGRGRGDIIVHQEINLPPDNGELTERMSIIGAAFRDQAISAFRQAQNAGF